ncbi:hypothetical protein BDA99DRAFT_244180 [Phascolomyces articulosus]|uniref:Uncharacterized protein n=1 Tax=Phascolomyces articulosus TaxID=60185 RepID=A0AAD5KLA2_9FUNG|nr:hypothetical protein BDA99DRAFT_244180 [Phascolomyces articulosus]
MRTIISKSLVQIQSHSEGFYGLLHDSSKIIGYDLTKKQITSTLSIPLELKVDRLLSTDKFQSEELDPLLRKQLGLSGHNGLFYYTSKGMVYYHDAESQTDTFVTEFANEKPLSIHFLRLNASMYINAVVILGREQSSYSLRPPMNVPFIKNSWYLDLSTMQY